IKDFFYSQFIFAFTSIAGFLVFIPGGVGIVEGSMSSFLTMFFGMTLPQAVFATLIFRFSTLWFGLSLGLIFLLQYLKSNK
ncbi:MAG TPA: lysylphosphatidylglycerol synthase domain-containing protein, partial [Candidatus Nitrosocosmicus sp.]|nr:lysylphosphatidylglycerol synthase domain-containing protein [Candidatus Nitrosocosmicus sp.]